MARLQRSDLAKEFSDLVKQEIKNHNDSILATNVSLNSMRNDLEDMKAMSQIEAHEVNRYFRGYDDSLAIIKEAFESSVQKLQRDFNDRTAQSKSDLGLLRKFFEDRSTYFMTTDGFDQFSKKIDQWTANIQRSFQVQNDVLRNRCNQISDQTQQAIEIHRSAVQKSIDQEIEDRKKQDVTLDHFAVNFSGMQQEIEKVKKRCFIIEKNIENLYTQIERLKEAK